ncbi:hypothetical protein RB195_004214 [Necator americanus]|uniref:Uncharacterized protein n=1 Tax=Necator americanus TaxID=51031 RepID=A0ABR1BKN7_NECAM
MINVFNSPIEASSIDEFAEGRSDQQQVFEKVIDGVMEDEQTPNALWTTTISRGVANDWRAKAEGGPFYRAKRYGGNGGAESSDFPHKKFGEVLDALPVGMQGS